MLACGNHPKPLKERTIQVSNVRENDPHHTPTDLLRVVLVGDQQTAERIEMLENMAAQHGAAVAAVYAFEPGEADSCHELTEVDALVSAVGCAISTRLPIWMPYPREDLGREQHFRRLGLVLQRHGLDLLIGAELWPCPTTGGISQIDSALRSEVQAIDNLDRAALAAGGAEILGREIEEVLIDAARGDQDESLDIEISPPLALPSPHAPWAQRKPVLRRYAMWLTHNCGLTQAAVAQCLNPTGHRTPQGCLWKRATVSALLKGRYDRAPGNTASPAAPANPVTRGTLW
jgi:hypothetical protein